VFVALNKSSEEWLDRRAFFVLGGLGFAGLMFGCRDTPAAEAIGAAGAAGATGGAAAGAAAKEVTIVEFSEAGVRGSTVKVPKVVKTDAEWRQQLSPLAFSVTRKADTEIAGTGSLLKVHEPGLFRCICCDTALFDAATKFESGTGWPSFWQPIAKENVIEIRDSTFGMDRTAVSCRRCDAHLGHVFDDGPKPTGLRYCMNSVAMRFAKRA
jgi:peptide-methionine (R)-S-oxide reductase